MCERGNFDANLNYVILSRNKSALLIVVSFFFLFFFRYHNLAILLIHAPYIGCRYGNYLFKGGIQKKKGPSIETDANDTNSAKESSAYKLIKRRNLRLNY